MGIKLELLEATSSEWIWVFIIQLLIYLAGYWALSKPAISKVENTAT